MISQTQASNAKRILGLRFQLVINGSGLRRRASLSNGFNIFVREILDPEHFTITTFQATVRVDPKSSLALQRPLRPLVRGLIRLAG